MRIIGLDPGCKESAYCIFDTSNMKVVEKDKVDNCYLLDVLRRVSGSKCLAIEEIHHSYGNAIGRETTLTIEWIGRYKQFWVGGNRGLCFGAPRHEIKKHFCQKSAGVNDAMIISALRDRFALGVRNHGKGTKAEPGFFFGFKRDVWQAFAVAIYAYDKQLKRGE